MLVVGMKADVADEERMVSKEAATEWAASVGLEYIEVSAKTTLNVSNTFCHTARALLRGFDAENALRDKKSATPSTHADNTISLSTTSRDPEKSQHYRDCCAL